MPWQIRYHDTRPEHPQVGDLYPAPWLLDELWREHLSPQYEREFRGKRPPLVIVLPGNAGHFCIDFRAWSSGTPHGDGWAVSGDPPNITLSPSINVVGAYHGWIQNGVLTDDCEGRTFR